jgi:hypothetical protein
VNRTVLLVIISSLLFSCSKASEETEPEKKGEEQQQEEPKKGDDFTGTYSGIEVLSKYRKETPADTFKTDSSYAMEYKIIQLTDSTLELDNNSVKKRFYRLYPASIDRKLMYTWDGNAVSVAHLYLSEDSIDYYCKIGGGAGGYAPHSIIRFSGRKL